MITARFRWNVENLRKGFAIHCKTLRMTKLILVMAVVLIGWGAYEAFTSERWVEGLPLVIFGTVLFLGARPLAFWQFRRAARRAPSYDSEITYTFDPQQIVVAGEGHHSTFTWKKLYSATISNDGILLYPQKTLFHWVPVTAFATPSDLASVRGFLEQNGVRTRNA